MAPKAKPESVEADSGSAGKMANGRKVARFAEQRFADAPLLRTLGENAGHRPRFSEGPAVAVGR
jgi:hypothetical protein